MVAAAWPLFEASPCQHRQRRGTLDANEDVNELGQRGGEFYVVYEGHAFMLEHVAEADVQWQFIQQGLDPRLQRERGLGCRSGEGRECTAPGLLAHWRSAFALLSELPLRLRLRYQPWRHRQRG